MILNLREFAVATGLAVSALCTGTACGEQLTKPDGRLPALRNFFGKYRSPLAARAGEFLKVSDKFALDWRLLPSLVIIESGGRNIRNNNVFGWGNGASRFRTVAESISIVADCLTNKVPYRGKSFEDKMKAYNPRRRDYAKCVRKMMDQIATTDTPSMEDMAVAVAGN
ncbi:MAG TPA: hypothetical protein VGL53_09090 [Bryobacteraceae bacterium]|jgi:hypothetical protein